MPKTAEEVQAVEVLSWGEQVSAVGTVSGWYVVGAVADAAADRLSDLPLLKGPFPSLEAAKAWWLGRYVVGRRR